MNYPVRGIIEQVKAGLIEIETAVDVINIYISTASKKSYNEGIVDTLNIRSEVTGGRIKGEEVQTHTSIPKRKIKGCLLDGIFDQCLYDWDPDVPCPCPYMEEHKTNVGCPNYKEME